MAKWAVRYGAGLRKRYLAVEKDKKQKRICDVCGKKAVRRIGTGIWKCKSCGATFAGGAYVPKTEAGKNVERALAQGASKVGL